MFIMALLVGAFYIVVIFPISAMLMISSMDFVLKKVNDIRFGVLLITLIVSTFFFLNLSYVYVFGTTQDNLIKIIVLLIIIAITLAFDLRYILKRRQGQQ